jgi:hypothetical protein
MKHSHEIFNNDPEMIFVFGSNEAGKHGAGAAKTARDHYGAILGIGVGRTGNSYAIPTKDANLNTLSIPKIEKYVREFILYAKTNPTLAFEVTKIGCGLAEYTEDDIKPLFENAPVNCFLPDGW